MGGCIVNGLPKDGTLLGRNGKLSQVDGVLIRLCSSLCRCVEILEGLTWLQKLEYLAAALLLNDSVFGGVWEYIVDLDCGIATIGGI